MIIDVCSISKRETGVRETSTGLRAFPTRAVVLPAIPAVTARKNIGGLAMRFRVRGQRLEGRWKTALAERRLAEGSDDVMSPDAGVVVPEGGRGGVAWRSRTKGTPGAWFCSPGRAMTRLCVCFAGFLLVAGLAVLAAAPAHAEDGDLRLRGGASHNEGRLEVYHDNEWGTVCDDFFGRVDAKVACKQMDYTGAEAVLTDVAVASGRRFWLDDVNCVGDEAKLTECFYNSNVRNMSSRTSPQWGMANCIPAEQVGVRCTASASPADNSVELDKSHLTVQEEGGGSTYTVRLGKAPTGDVTVAISGQSSTVTVDSTPLTFTTGNWSTPQRVTLTAFDDSNRTDDSFTLTHTASGGGYGSVTESLSVTVEDDDGPVQAHIDSGGIVSLTEGGSRTYRIWLDSAPSEQVTVALTAPSKVSVNPASLTFTTGNWSTPADGHARSVARQRHLRRDAVCDAQSHQRRLHHDLEQSSGGNYGRRRR